MVVPGVPADALGRIRAYHQGPGGNRGHVHDRLRQARGKVFGVRGARHGQRDGPKQRVRRQGRGQWVLLCRVVFTLSVLYLNMYQHDMCFWYSYVQNIAVANMA